MPFQIGDVVRVVKQPADLIVQIKGEVGFIDELNETHARIQTLKLDDSCGGCGGVLLSCLAPETAPQWLEIKAKHDADLAKRTAEYKAFAERVDAGKKKIAEKYGVSVETVEKICQEVRELYPY
jgi:hypothetical protein